MLHWPGFVQARVGDGVGGVVGSRVNAAHESSGTGLKVGLEDGDAVSGVGPGGDGPVGPGGVGPVGGGGDGGFLPRIRSSGSLTRKSRRVVVAASKNGAEDATLTLSSWCAHAVRR